MKPSFWDERYGQADFAYGVEPNEFLASHAGHIRRGRVLCLAEGEGRNAVYLAQLGYQVRGVDLSAVGLKKAEELARNQGVTIETQIADLATLEIEPGFWQGIVSIFAHVPSAVRRELHRKVVAGLAPGGVLLLEAYTVRQWETGGVGGPNREQRDLFMSLKELESELSGLHFVLGQEIERDINEGRFHRGRGAVVQVAAERVEAAFPGS